MADPQGYGRGSIITPEAVLLDFELAGVASRSLAFAVDFIMQLIAVFLMFLVVGLVSAGLGDIAGLIVVLVGIILIVFGYPILFETLNQGRTIGRMVVGTRVVTVEGAPIRFRQAVIRAFLGIIDLYVSFGGVAVVSSLLTRRGQRLGDLAAGTMIIRDKTSPLSSASTRFWAAPHLVEWADTIDTSALGNDGYQLVRDYLIRRTELAEPTQSSLGVEISNFVGERLPLHVRPDHMHPVQYLSAVAASTQSGADRNLNPPPPPPAGARVFDGPPPPPAGSAAVGNAPPPPNWAAAAQAPPPPQPSWAAPAPSSQPARPGGIAAVPAAPSPPPPPPPPPPPQDPVPPTAPNEGGFAAPG